MPLTIEMETSSQRLGKACSALAGENPMEILEIARKCKKTAQTHLWGAGLSIRNTKKRNLFVVTGDASLVSELRELVDPISWKLS